MKQTIEQEKRMVEMMLRLYCRRHEGHSTLCPGCAALLAYAHRRLDHCRWGDNKPTCRRCPVHCYAPGQRERIRQVMRWAGPRMLFLHPVATIRHLLQAPGA